jgi:GAF domain-containing protein
VQRPQWGADRDRHVLSWQLPGGGLCALEPVISATPLDPLAAFAELGRMKLGERDLQAVLGRVAELARQTLPGVAGASVTLVESDRAFTAAFTGQLPLDLDETQYRDGFGPCLEVAQSAGIVTVPDMAAETRWPAFARQALAAGVHSSLSVALPLQETVLGALNIYATQPAVFGQDAIEMARTFAGYAAVAIANARLYQNTAALAEDMRRAMETRAVIEQAKGILIAQQHCTPEQAFELLTRLSQATHRKLRDCAADLVTSTGQDGPAGSRE